MASFPSKFKISSLFQAKCSEYSILVQNPTKAIKNVRHFWLPRLRKPQETKTVQTVKGNCGKPVPPPVIEPCRLTLDCSACENAPKPKRKFEIFRKKSTAVEAKSGSEVTENPKLSLWENIFGPHPRRSWPDPCTCRVAYRRRKMCRAENPRLKDPRYKATPGDVLLYTEFPKKSRGSCMEPQPKPPPSFKLPNAVLCRKIVEMAEKVPRSDFQSDQRCEDINPFPLDFKIPYDELRPIEKGQRRSFTCQEGIRCENVIKPRSQESNLYAMPLDNGNLERLNVHIKRPTKSRVETVEKLETSSIKKVDRRSRIEQLKILVLEKSL